MKKISVFIDAANIYHAQKENGWNIDFLKLKDYLAQRGEIAQIFYFTPTPPYNNPNAVKRYRKFKEFLVTLNFTVIDKEIKEFKGGDKKGNLDIEMAYYILTSYDDFNEMILLSGDGDFAILINHLITNGKIVTCIANKRATALEVRNLATNFINLKDLKDILQKIIK